MPLCWFEVVRTAVYTQPGISIAWRPSSCDCSFGRQEAFLLWVRGDSRSCRRQFEFVLETNICDLFFSAKRAALGC